MRLCFLCTLILTAWLLLPQKRALHLNPGNHTSTHYVPAVKSECFLFRFCSLIYVCVTLSPPAMLAGRKACVSLLFYRDTHTGVCTHTPVAEDTESSLVVLRIPGVCVSRLCLTGMGPNGSEPPPASSSLTHDLGTLPEAFPPWASSFQRMLRTQSPASLQGAGLRSSCGNGCKNDFG